MMVSFPRPKPLYSAEAVRRAQRPNCPHCGRRLQVAEQSRFNLTGRVDNFWACDDCGAQFATSIEVKRRAVA
jgi:ribosomal protein L37AE/L43A